jgi:hypothetical protein
MPRSSRALLPAEIRTRSRPKSARADTLMGFLRLSRAFPWDRGTGFPAPSLLRFRPAICERSAVRRSRALSRPRVGRPLAGPTDSLEVLHQDLTSVSPDDRGVLSDKSDWK